MTANCNQYTRPHRVVIMLERKLNTVKEGVAGEVITAHQCYYQSLQQAGKVISYGQAMNTPGCCIILSVLSDDDFRNIMDNDPGLQSGCYEVISVMPFGCTELS